LSALNSGAVASWKDDTSDCICPKADSCVCMPVALFCSLVSGNCSTAISLVMMFETSRPLPMPAEEIEPAMGNPCAW